MDCPRCPVANKSSISSFSVKSFKESCSNGCSVLRYLSTVATSQMVLYLGCGLRVSYIPFRNQVTSGWEPKGLVPSLLRINDNADLAVFIVE